MHCGECSTSMPKKYRRCPRSFILNLEERKALVSVMLHG